MNKKIGNLKTFLLIITFIPSLTLFWNIVTIVTGAKNIYLAFQFMFASYYTLFSIFLTADIFYFNEFWATHPRIFSFFKKILHLSGVFIAWIPSIVYLLPLAISDCSSKKDFEEIKQLVKTQIQEYDSSPIEARTLLPVGALSLIMLVLFQLSIFPETFLSFIQEVLNTIVSGIGFIFVAVNAKESTHTFNNTSDPLIEKDSSD